MEYIRAACTSADSGNWSASMTVKSEDSPLPIRCVSCIATSLNRNELSTSVYVNNVESKTMNRSVIPFSHKGFCAHLYRLLLLYGLFSPSKSVGPGTRVVMLIFSPAFRIISVQEFICPWKSWQYMIRKILYGRTTAKNDGRVSSAQNLCNISNHLGTTLQR